MKNLVLSLYYFLKFSLSSFHKKYNSLIYFILGIIATLVITSFNNKYSIYFFIAAIGLTLLLIIFFICFVIYKFIPIKLLDYSCNMYFLDNDYQINFSTPSLMLDETFTTTLRFEVELYDYFKYNIKNVTKNGIPFYTLVVEKDKSISVEVFSEYLNDETDIQSKSRGKNYYFLVQEYKNQNKLEFTLNFSSNNLININDSCKIYLEYGDIHDRIDDSFVCKNKFFDKNFFVTNLNTIFKKYED